MTNEEAKERLIDFKPYLATEEWKECYQVAIEALKKQIPKKPKGDRCPCCGSQYGLRYDDWGERPKVCTECGQRLDWGGKE